MNIKGMNQLDIEQEFDMSKVKQELGSQVVEYIDLIEAQLPKIEEVMSKYLDDIDIGDIHEVAIAVISLLGNENSGVILGQASDGKIRPLSANMTKIDARDIPLSVFIKTLYKDRFISKTLKSYAIDFVMDLISELDTIFFDVVQRIEMIEDGQFRTLTYVRTELLFSHKASLLAHYERFRLPLIEEPHQWSKGKRGGYHLNKQSCITNKGNENQENNVLEILNKLQSNKFTHKANVKAEKQFIIDKFIKDGNSEVMALRKSENMVLTLDETYNAIGDSEIYFEWKFDSRGRMYSTGYDINLQGNKAKKGALRPVLW